jgi:hypothetical protein
MKAAHGLALSIALAIAPSSMSSAHDIYTSVHGKNGQLCCGGNDCAATSYRENGAGFEFKTREGDWVAIPQDRITFLPIPGDQPSSDSHYGHLCYRQPREADLTGPGAVNVFGPIYLYCAFIPPGGV